MNNKSLFIINSPFQALCAFEAINHFKESNPEFFVFDCDDSKDKIVKLLKQYGYEPTIIPFVGTRHILKILNKFDHYERIYIGDYFSYLQYLIAVNLAKRKSVFVYLDDGTATLDLLPSTGRKRYRGLSKRALSYRLLDIKVDLKQVKTIFFTIFDIGKETKFNTVKNTFGFLPSDYSNIAEAGIYIIGTNSSVISFKDESYDELLRKLIKNIRDRFPNTPIYYCPHRRDTNNHDSLLKEQGVNLFQTEISVEVDFVTKKVNPLLIVGFASTALITLKLIYPSCVVESVRFNIEDEFTTKSIRSIENYYLKNNIGIIQV